MAIEPSSDKTKVFQRILVVSEPGRNGAAALAQAAAIIAASSSSRLTIVATAPQTTTTCRNCGGVSPDAYNRAIREDVAHDLHNATAQLKLDTRAVKVKLLIEGTDPPLTDWIAQERFDLVLLPARRSGLRLRSHPAAHQLQNLTEADVHVVSASGQEQSTRPS
jgi:hypothetical protein